jgi:DNA-binding MarR family transcriptional regulator
MIKNANKKEFIMTQTMQWYMNLTGKIFERIGSHTNAEIGKFIEDTEALEGPDIGLLQIGYAFSPEPLTTQSFIERSPYTNPDLFGTQMDDAVERGWLEKIGDGQYELSAIGRETVDRFFKMGNQLFSELPSLSEAESNRTADLLAKVVTYANQLPKPASKPTLQIGLRLNPGGYVAPMLRIRRHLTDLAYFRDDAHISAWQPYDVDGIVWETLTFLWQDDASTAADMAEQVSQYRNYDEKDYTAAFEKLVANGWAGAENGKYLITDKGKKTRQDAEDVTDQYFYTAFDVLSQEEIEELKTLLEKLAEVVEPPKEEAESA